MAFTPVDYIASYFGWNQFTPALPNFYWDVYSAEERVKKICLELDKLCKYANMLADNINIDHTLVEELQNALKNIENIDELNEQVELIEQVLENIPDYSEFQTLTETVSNHTTQIANRTPLPTSPNSKWGINGQVLRTNGDGSTQWQNPIVPTDTQAQTYIQSWLDQHPEATTTVADGSITAQKLANGAVTDTKLDPNGVLRTVNSIIESHALTRVGQGAQNFDCTIHNGDTLHIKNDADTNTLVRLRENSETTTFLQIITAPANADMYVKATTNAGNITCFFYGAGTTTIEIGRFVKAELQIETNKNNIATIQEDIYNTYTSDDAVDGYCNQNSTSGSTSNLGKLLVLPVEAGDRFHINVRVYGYMGAYNITDEYGSIIAYSINEDYGSASVHKVYDEVLTIPVGGKYLYLSSETSYGLTAKQMPVIENIRNTLENATMFRFLYPNAICIGDSTTQGVGYTRQYFTYPIFLSKFMQANVTNAGESSTGAKMWWNSHHGEYDYSQYFMAIINLGTNYGLTDTIAADTASGDYTTYANTNTGKYCAIIEEILNQNPNCNIFLAYPQCRTGLVEPDETAEQTSITVTCSVIDQIAAKYDLDILDDRNHWKVYPYTDPDNVHFTPMGNLYRAYTYINQICQKINANRNKYNPPRP